MTGHPVQPAIPISSTPIMDGTFPESQLMISPSALVGTLSDTQTPGRKRVAPGDVVERSVERRQKRMIKNRESSARSRARKQAYTNELENNISRLEEENDKLKRQKPHIRSVLRKFFPEENGAITKIDPIGNSPVIVRKESLEKIAPTWMNVSLTMKKDPEADKAFGWVPEILI